MPTPFYHLSIAEEVLKHPELNPGTLILLQQQRPAFLFGNTAPDVQTVSRQNRVETHFFDLPMLPDSQPPWINLIRAYPDLSHFTFLPPAQQAFLAGYLCHLQADWLWVLQIYLPVFGPDNKWHTRRQRSYLHNVLRAYLDLKLLANLHPDIAEELAAAMPDNWLPFVRDAYLSQWRDYLTGQLCIDCETQTVQVFASRQGISPDVFFQLLNSEENLDKEIFSRLPRRAVLLFRNELIRENVILLNQLSELDQTVWWNTTKFSYGSIPVDHHSSL